MSLRAIDRPTSEIRTVPRELAIEASEIATLSAKCAGVLSRNWAAEPALLPLPEVLADIAERALALRRHALQLINRGED